jgi:ribonuclease HII
MTFESVTIGVEQQKRNRLKYERRLWRRGVLHVAGLDEAGRGPLAGPVVAAAVVFPHDFFEPEIDDSKVVEPCLREELYDRIMQRALGIGVGIVDHTTIDRINILNATYQAMHEALRQLPFQPSHLLIDGNRFSPIGIDFTTIVDGDALSFTVAAASIIAKVTRDRLMVQYDAMFPGYGFAQHKGYATPEHREAIFRLGLCDIHRRSFHLKSQIELEFVR